MGQFILLTRIEPTYIIIKNKKPLLNMQVHLQVCFQHHYCLHKCCIRTGLGAFPSDHEEIQKQAFGLSVQRYGLGLLQLLTCCRLTHSGNITSCNKLLCTWSSISFRCPSHLQWQNTLQVSRTCTYASSFSQVIHFSKSSVCWVVWSLELV